MKKVKVNVGDIYQELKPNYMTSGWSFPGAQWIVDEVNYKDDYCLLSPYNDIARKAMQELVEAGEADPGDPGIEMGLYEDEFFSDVPYKIITKSNKVNLPAKPTLRDCESHIIDLLFKIGIPLDKLNYDYDDELNYAAEALEDLMSAIYDAE